MLIAAPTIDRGISRIRSWKGSTHEIPNGFVNVGSVSNGPGDVRTTNIAKAITAPADHANQRQPGGTCPSGNSSTRKTPASMISGTQKGPEIASAILPNGSAPCRVSKAYCAYPSSGTAIDTPISNMIQPIQFRGTLRARMNPTIGNRSSPTADRKPSSPLDDQLVWVVAALRFATAKVPWATKSTTITTPRAQAIPRSVRSLTRCAGAASSVDPSMEPILARLVRTTKGEDATVGGVVAPPRDRGVRAVAAPPRKPYGGADEGGGRT